MSQGLKVGRFAGWLFVVALLAGCSAVPSSAPTVDPFAAVAHYGGVLTQTAIAPVIEMQRAEQEMEFQKIYWTATAEYSLTATAVPLTATAQAWTPTPAPTSTPDVVATGTAMGIMAQAQLDQLEIEQTQATNMTWAYVPFALMVLATMVTGFVLWWLSRRFAYIPNPVDERGRAMPMLNVLDGVAWDIERATNGMAGTRRLDLLGLPMITAERQDVVTARSQYVDLRTRAAALPTTSTRGSERHIEPTSAVSRPSAASAYFDLPLPTWEAFLHWDGDARPLGMGRDGLITTRTASPHVLISGKTGSGKTLYGLRTMVTASLSRGVYVVNVGFSDSGFGVFASHPNYKAVKFQQSADIIPFLQAVYGELRGRVDAIGGKSADWEHWQGTLPAPFVDIVIDELGNMAEDIYVSEGADAAKTLWRWVSMIANEGRKVGIRFLAALQDPTAKSVDLRFRRNCTLVAFQQGDASQSSAFLGTTGAEALPVGRFMARVDSVTVGGGFAPTDAEITEYLSRHEARQVESPRWLQVEDSKSQVQLPIIEPTKPADAIAADKGDDVQRLAEGIRGQWFIGMSKNAVARALGFRQYGGGHVATVNAVVAYLEASTTSTAVKMPVFEAVGAL